MSKTAPHLPLAATGLGAVLFRQLVKEGIGLLGALCGVRRDTGGSSRKACVNERKIFTGSLGVQLSEDAKGLMDMHHDSDELLHCAP